MGNKVNIQDGACIHCTYQKTKTIIGNNVSIGHHAIVHGCTVANNVLIGMGAIVMDNAIIGENSIIAAGAVVLEGTEVPPGSIFAGVPARKVKDISPLLLKGEVERIADITSCIAHGLSNFPLNFKSSIRLFLLLKPL